MAHRGSDGAWRYAITLVRCDAPSVQPEGDDAYCDLCRSGSLNSCAATRSSALIETDVVCVEEKGHASISSSSSRRWKAMSVSMVW